MTKHASFLLLSPPSPTTSLSLSSISSQRQDRKYDKTSFLTPRPRPRTVTENAETATDHIDRTDLPQPFSLSPLSDPHSHVATLGGPHPAYASLWGYHRPEVAHRKTEAARREAKLLVVSPVSVTVTTVCSVCLTVTETIETIRIAPPVQTTYQEIVKDRVGLPNWMRDPGRHVEEIPEHGKEIVGREDAVNRREHDASRRKTWIMEQLIVLGDEALEEAVYERQERPQGPDPAQSSYSSQPQSKEA
ncbi:hypothetical protein BD410DRAFT_855574 [Rickenella mellea]|uniref:Uncharacterized protein n=1 Tax=Rickenella mellea TaxID=50990 RepID=A0A4Y7Q8Y2_9AGAM|nr:hypothetical protein BD410DRAFT_855574 [Rickenella mellea]